MVNLKQHRNILKKNTSAAASGSVARQIGCQSNSRLLIIQNRCEVTSLSQQTNKKFKSIALTEQTQTSKSLHLLTMDESCTRKRVMYSEH
jgi:hypothetical protein